MKQYSFKKGLWKGLGTVAMIATSLVVLSGLSDLTLWVLLETYIKPILGTLTVGGTLTIAMNYIKVKGSN